MVPIRARRLVLALVLLLPMACTLPGVGPGGRPGDGEVQVFVAQNHPALVADVEAGGGPVLDGAMAVARVNPATREILLLRLQSELPLYRRSPLAMASVITAHGDRAGST
jgi:hypothetical protein